jgi:prevent-host-death family protein
MTATDAARGFSEVLNRVAAGDEIEVTRAGAPVAVITSPTVRFVSAERFRELIATAPEPDEAFAIEVQALREAVVAPDQPLPS